MPLKVNCWNFASSLIDINIIIIARSLKIFFLRIDFFFLCWYIAATPNWMQRALNDLGHTLCSHSPSLRRLTLHSKVNPFNLLIVGGALTVVLTQLLIDLE